MKVDNYWENVYKKAQEDRDRKEALAEHIKANQFEIKYPKWYVRNNSRVLNSIDSILSNPDEPKHILLSGSVGSGKTLLARLITECIVPRVMFEEYRVRWYEASSLWEGAKEKYSLNKYLKPGGLLSDYVIIDDIGAEDDTAASRSYIRSFLHAVYNKWQSGGFKLLVVTTNLGVDTGIQNRYGERIRSRFDEMFNYLVLQTIDFRTKKRRGVNENREISNEKLF